MSSRSFLLTLFLGCLINASYAQAPFTGKIYQGTTDTVIPRASVLNKTTAVHSSANDNGSFSIRASEGDTLIISAIGYTTDTIRVEFFMLLAPHDINLLPQIGTLAAATVFSNYSADSMARRNYYQEVFAKQPGITGFNRPEKGFGIVLSPFSFFSAEAKQKRRLKKRLLHEEKEDYIDRSFPRAWIQRLTGLQGDSLHLFLYRFRPTYKFCRKTDRQGMILYISEKLSLFRNAETRLQPAKLKPGEG